MTALKAFIPLNTILIWIFNMKYLTLITFLFLSACNSLRGDGQGQVIYHWERENTGIQKFSRDHSECLKSAESWWHWPDFSSWLYTEEYRYNIVVDWHKDKGIWSSYVPYRGASPLLVNSIRDTADSDPRTYRLCMEAKGYWHRTYDLPTVTNVFVYKPQKGTDYTPLENVY